MTELNEGKQIVAFAGFEGAMRCVTPDPSSKVGGNEIETL
jgi:hypothetical protein